MATQWVLGKVSEALAPTVSGAVSTAGSFAGGAIGAVGNTINGVGEGINGSIRRYGDGAKDYGNAIMDWTRADGLRAATSSNPLGLSSGMAGGKRQVTSPQVYRAPPRSNATKMLTTNKTAAPQKKIEAGTPRKALPAPGPKPVGAHKSTTSAGAPVKKAAAPSNLPQTKATPNPGAMRKKPAGTTNQANGAAKPPTAVKKSTPVKPSTASVPKTTSRPKAPVSATAAANPLGLSF